MMAICYFDENKEKYNCEYSIENNVINIEVEYDILDEIEAIGGKKAIRAYADFSERDILIIDYNSKIALLAKDCIYNGSTADYSGPYSKNITRFKSQHFFKHKDPEVLKALPKTPKIKSLKIYSKDLVKSSGSVITVMDNTDSLIYELNRKKSPKTVGIGSNNIKQLSLEATWNSKSNNLDYISVDINAFVKIDFVKRVNYDDIFQYLNELILYMQLYKPDNFKVSKIVALIDNNWLDFTFPTYECNKNKRAVLPSVKVDLLSFLQNAYKSIAFRKGKQSVRNIPYIVLNTSRHIEDNFLTYYRFIECFTKSSNTKGTSYSVFNTVMKNKCSLIHKSDEEINKIAQEVVSLRNHYIHNGYYLRNDHLKINFPSEIKNKYCVDKYDVTVDSGWIYEKTKILYLISIDIIFREILNYSDYDFKRIW